MNDEKKACQYHDRADHEDNLHVSRTGLFISFNGFLAVAVGLVGDQVIKTAFVCIAVAVDALWAVWAPKARRFIRALRDAGRDRDDEKLWRSTVGGAERHRWIGDPLTLTSAYIPGLLLLGWLVILLYLSSSRSTAR
jgi:hypothetical protein